ncbi:hypothetical protein PVAP13_2KG030400 [Panicum virgatum]|uniref:Bisdemethoxycurcumin synthase-like n=1 Tax=Panicum virgatum TaxID=38727 RepID=A0A8T0VWX8_PANVG|nr:hypothetical protein PVAP13_2KG030400 [Panicum virgatum]
MMASILATVSEIRREQRADGPAAMLGIGTANPTKLRASGEVPRLLFSCHKQGASHEPQRYIQETMSDHGGRETFLSPQRASPQLPPGLLLHGTPSALDARLDIVAKAAPGLAASAAAKAIVGWGRPATDITHLVVSTNAEARSPGADLGLAMLLGLRPDVRRTVLQLNGCSAGCAALRLAKDLAENNRGARVLVVCVELTITSFRSPHEGDTFDTLIPQALFGDGAGAVVIGADVVHPVEHSLFEMVFASQALIPGSEKLLNIRLGEGGIQGDISFNLPRFAAQNLEGCLLDAFRTLAVSGVECKWNDLFWAVHPGSLGILDHIDAALKLEPRKLAASRTVVRNYGNMLSATVIFVLEELRRRMDEEGDKAAELGMMVGFGPGFTVETMVLHATKY